MVNLDLLIILAGVVYGYVRPGKEDKMKILKNGFKWGLVIGVVLGIIGFILKRSLVALGAGVAGVFVILIVALAITIEFIIGTFLGDLLEGVLKK